MNGSKNKNHFSHRMGLRGLCVVLTLPLMLFGGIAFAADAELADVTVAGTHFTADVLIPYNSVKISLAGPDGSETSRTFGRDETIAFDLGRGDGLYKYEMRFEPRLDDETRAALARSRRDGTPPPDLGDAIYGDMVMSGAFTIAQGTLVATAEEVPVAGKGGLDKVVLTNSNGVIRNALCVGFDCPDSPAFGDSSVLMMENNNRIKFGDTSNAPFPNNDWEIEANSNLSGGQSYLGFNDCGTADNDGSCTTDLVFAVEAGARSSALYVESDGDVGVGTSNPVVEMHLVRGDSPTLRLEQDGSSGFQPQTWDLAGNETSFFIRDATNGSTLPFRIRPGASSQAIVIDTDDDVGFGLLSPEAPLHIVRNGAVQVRLENTNAGVEWNFNNAAGGDFRISDVDGVANTEFILDGAGNLEITGEITTSGSCSGGCDRVFSPEFPLESIEDHSDFMWRNSYLPGVGPTPEDGPFNITKKVGGLLNELEKAHIYIDRLNRDLQDKDSELDELRQRLEALEALVNVQQ